jgi:hypothetical protein
VRIATSTFTLTHCPSMRSLPKRKCTLGAPNNVNVIVYQGPDKGGGKGLQSSRV